MPNHPPRQPRHCLTAKRCVSLLDFRDLLSKDGEKLDIKINPDGTGQLHVPGLRIIEVKSFQHIKKVTQHVAHLHSEEARTSTETECRTIWQQPEEHDKKLRLPMLKRSVPVFNVLDLMFEKFKGPKEHRQDVDPYDQDRGSRDPMMLSLNIFK